MSEILFSFSKRSEKKANDYVGIRALIVEKKPEPGMSSKIRLSSEVISQASLMLTGDENISFGYMGEDPILVFKTQKEPTSCRLAKNGTISNKKLHKTLVQIFELNDEVENVIVLDEIQTSSDVSYCKILGLRNNQIEFSEIKAEISENNSNEEYVFEIPEVNN